MRASDACTVRYAPVGVHMKVVSHAGLAFSHSELKTGFTLVRIARSANGADKRNRYLLNTRKAVSESRILIGRGLLLRWMQSPSSSQKLSDIIGVKQQSSANSDWSELAFPYPGANRMRAYGECVCDCDERQQFWDHVWHH